MKRLIFGCIVLCGLWACQESEPVTGEFTGNEVVYSLEQGSTYAIDGTVTIKEKKNGSALISVYLSGTEGAASHPVHIHLGNISNPGADVYVLLNPVTGSTGLSETIVDRASDESALSYKSLLELNSCIKVHLAASGPDRDIILAAGNIGKSASDFSGGRTIIATCKSE